MSMQLKKLVSSFVLVSVAAAAIACSGEAPAPPSKNEGPFVGAPAPGGTTTAPVAATPAPVTTTTPTAAGACTPADNSPCETCAVGKCCAQIQAFEADPQAQQYDACAAPCQQAQSEQQYMTCMQQCDARHPQTAAKSEAIYTCVEQQCATQCAQPGQ